MMVTRKIYKVLAAVVMVGGLAATAPSGAFAADAPSAPSSASVSPEIAKRAAELESRFVNTEVTRGNTTTVVTFADHSGKTYRYEFSTVNLTKTGASKPIYKVTASGWDLNRSETYELIGDGSSAAIIYALGAAVGCTPCAVGAAIESNWSTRANSAYSRGNCIHLNFWFTADEYSGGYCK